MHAQKLRGALVTMVALCSFAPRAGATHQELYAALQFVPFAGGAFDHVERVSGNQCPTASDPVATPVGEFTTWAMHLLLGGGPIPLGFGCHFGGFVGQAANFWGFYGTTASPMGANWVHNHQFLLKKFSATEVAVYYLRGKVIFFDKVGAAWQMAPAPAGFVYMGTPYQMVANGTKLEMMDPESRTISTFEFTSLANGAVAPIEKMRDRNDNTLTYTNNGDGTVALITDGLGRSLTFVYAIIATRPRVISVTDHSGRAVTFTYLSTGRLSQITSPRGTVTAFTYDSGSRILTHTRPRGNVPVTNTYNAQARCATQLDGEGNAWGLAYGTNQTTITDPLGNSRLHSFNAQLRLTGWRDETGQTVTMAYDANHRLVSTTDRMGAVSTIGYHAASGHVATRNDALGNTWTYTYVAQPQQGLTFQELSRIDYPDGTIETFTRDAKGNILSHTDREGEVSSRTVNSRGQVVTATNPAGGTHTFAYHPAATLASHQDPAGNTTTYSYDAISRLVQIARPDGSTAALAWDPNDNLVSRTDENGSTTSYTYDANDNLASASDPLGGTTALAYDGNDNLASMTEPLGATTTFTLDGLRRVVSRTDPAGAVVTYGYDSRRRLISIVDGAGETWSYAYDAEGVLTSSTNPLGQTTSYTTDALGRTSEIQDPLGNVTAYDYDPLGRVIRVTDPLSQVTDLARDAEGDVLNLDLPETVVSSYERNNLDQVTRVTDPRSNDWDFAYDTFGRRTSESDPVANVHSYAYDNRNRMETVAFPGGLGTADVTYDASSRLTQALFSDGTDLQFTYDTAGRLMTANGIVNSYDAADRLTSCNGQTMTYDADDRLTSVTLAPGKTVNYAYDGRDLVASVTDWLGGTTALTHDDAGRLLTVTRPNGVVTGYAYDAAGQLVSIEETAPGPVVLSALQLTRDARGQISGIVRDVPLAAVEAAGERNFTFDPACQEASLAYDGLGRCTSDGSRTYSWDLGSRLESFDAGDHPISFTHDAAGNLLSRTEGGETRQMVWNYGLGLPSISVVRTENGVAITTDERYYVHTPGGVLLHSVEADDNARAFYHFDQVGSTLFLTDQAGMVTDAYTYSPYGEVLGRTGSMENPFTWHGRYGVSEDGGLYNMRARWYDPVAARFLSRDPIRGTDPVRINPYQALFGDPIALVDPMGTDPDVAKTELDLYLEGLEASESRLDRAWGWFARRSYELYDPLGDTFGFWMTNEEKRLLLQRELNQKRFEEGKLKYAAAQKERNNKEEEAARQRNEEAYARRKSFFENRHPNCDCAPDYPTLCPFHSASPETAPPTVPGYFEDGFYPRNDLGGAITQPWYLVNPAAPPYVLDYGGTSGGLGSFSPFSGRNYVPYTPYTPSTQRESGGNYPHPSDSVCPPGSGK